MLPVIRRLPRLDAPESIFTYASRLGAEVNGRKTYPVALDRYLLMTCALTDGCTNKPSVLQEPG